MSRSICIAGLKEHSMSAWSWSSRNSTYKSECTLMGCSYVEYSSILIPIGLRKVIYSDGKEEYFYEKICDCESAFWRSTSDQMGTYLPPYAYKFQCDFCKKTFFTEYLIKPD